MTVWFFLLVLCCVLLTDAFAFGAGAGQDPTATIRCISLLKCWDLHLSVYPAGTSEVCGCWLSYSVGQVCVLLVCYFDCICCRLCAMFANYIHA